MTNIERLVIELGVTPEKVRWVLQGSNAQEAERRLQELKGIAAKAYRRLALQYHPDRNLGREDWAAGQFKDLGMAKQQVDALKIQARRPVVHRVVFHQPFFQTSATTASTTTTYTNAGTARIIFSGIW
jgi:hypothetical protein